MTVEPRYDETITLPRAVRFPVEMVPPQRFDAAEPTTWPRVDGRLEFVDGRLLYMPPCGDVQQDTVTDVVITLGTWIRKNPGFVLGTNEAGMRLHGATRAADAAIWRKSDVGAYQGGFRRVPPVLAVEVTGLDEPVPELLEKAQWYLEVGVAIVWIVTTESREVIVVTASGEERLSIDARIPAHAELPSLTPQVSELFVQLSGR